MIWWMRISVALLALLLMATSAAYPEDKPNIVLILADNLGYGELGSYGGGETRGAPTPRLRRSRPRRHAADQFQCRTFLYAEPLGAHDRSLFNSFRYLFCAN